MESKPDTLHPDHCALLARVDSAIDSIKHCREIIDTAKRQAEGDLLGDMLDIDRMLEAAEERLLPSFD